MRIIQIVIFGLLFGYFAVSNQAVAQSMQWISFEWSGYQAKTRYFDKSAILVKTKIDDLPHNFKMQFDLGATHTVIYGKTFESFKKDFATYEQKVDSTALFWYNGKKYPTYQSINLKLDKVDFKNIGIGKYIDYGNTFSSDTIDKVKSVVIGTIGVDLFQDKFLIIDYPNSKMCVTEKLPKQFEKVSFIDVQKTNDGRIFIPMEIDGKPERLLFDTGVAMFPLLTSEKNAKAIAEPIVKDSLDVNSWGKTYYTYGNTINKPVKLGKKQLPKGLVYYDKIQLFDEWFENNKFWGIIGNAYFINNVLIIDYKNNKIGVK